MGELIGYLIIIALIVAIIIYVIIPLLIVMSILGAIFGGGVGIYNYIRSFHTNVRPETDPKGRIAALCLGLVGLAMVATTITLLVQKSGR